MRSTSHPLFSFVVLVAVSLPIAVCENRNIFGIGTYYPPANQNAVAADLVRCDRPLSLTLAATAISPTRARIHVCFSMYDTQLVHALHHRCDLTDTYALHHRCGLTDTYGHTRLHTHLCDTQLCSFTHCDIIAAMSDSHIHTKVYHLYFSVSDTQLLSFTHNIIAAISSMPTDTRIRLSFVF